LWTSDEKTDVDDAATQVACVTTGSGESVSRLLLTAAALAALATIKMRIN
jgi:hypothetical protein